MSLLPLTGMAMKLGVLESLAAPLAKTEKTPLFFFGHGSPMNAIEENEFSKTWQTIGSRIKKPAAILCISAHWETKGTYVTAMPRPRTIHDFGGFPRTLFEVQYPAPGSPAIASTTQEAITMAQIELDHQWGLDHGCWSVVRHLYPAADIPVLQLSLDYTQLAEWHFRLAKELAPLRRKGILIIGSGNMVHNLRLVDWNKASLPEFGFDWALEANQKMKQYIINGDFDPLIAYQNQGKAFNLAIPTPEHYLPLLYILALQEAGEKASFFNDKAIMGSLTMTSVRIES